MANWFIDRTPHRATPSVQLRRLLPDARFLGGQDWEISGCTDDPSRVQPGHVYVATRDGHDDIDRALDGGASGVVVEKPSAEPGRRQAIVPDARLAHARLCHALAGDPADRLDLIAIADGGGGEGSAIRHFLRSILDLAGRRFGVVTASDWSDGFATLPIGSASPSAEDLARMLKGMVERRCVGGLVECVGDQPARSGLVEGVTFSAAIVSGVHRTSSEGSEALIERRRAYARLARRVRPGGVVVVNVDDPDSELLGAVNLDAERVSIGLDRPADVRGIVESVGPQSARFRVLADGVDVGIELGVGGVESIRRALAAFAMAWKRGIDTTAIVAGLEAVDALPDRFERVEEGQDFETWVDPASTPEAIAKAIGDLRAVVPGRLFCVIGAGGDGDRATRLRIAAVVEEGADGVVFTSDNPRGEDPGLILADLLAGVRRPVAVQVEPDRRRAIERALAMAGPGDAVLIAGKGRHAFQILADRVVPFDDRAVAARWLRASRRESLDRRESA